MTVTRLAEPGRIKRFGNTKTGNVATFKGVHHRAYRKPGVNGLYIIGAFRGCA